MFNPVLSFPSASALGPAAILNSDTSSLDPSETAARGVVFKRAEIKGVCSN